jgi:hypothetical protein
MNTAAIVILSIALVVAIGVSVWLFQTIRRSKALQERFGPEYDKTLAERRSKREAEAELAAREKRVEKLTIRPLSAEDRKRYLEAWRLRQEHFVENPRTAVTDVDLLVEEVMRARGYPVGDFERQAADVSVDHPNLVENYRAAHAIAQRSRDGRASTEDLRNAMLHFRALFDDLLEDHPVRASA